MSKIAISCDTTAALSKEQIKELGIFVLPLNVIVDDKEYHDTVDINPEMLAKMMRGGSSIKTSTPSPVEVYDFFDKIFAKGYEKIIHFTISSKLSSIYNMFTLLCKEKYGDKVIIVDALSVCTYMGATVQHAVKLNNAGVAPEEIAKECIARQGCENIYFIPESLTYLKRGGRISPAAAAFGNLLGIKPVLRFNKGAIEKETTTRSVKQFLPNIVANFKSKNYDPKKWDIHIVIFDCPTIANLVNESMKENFPEYKIIVSPISINVCAHCGPGTIGIGFTLKD
ncbi:MAG: DegV family protein [Bacilli bacterium]|nr:DegV family protein [Bacilli bacterium]